ncbi:hypothetical protein GGX14DRAFT_455348, partial [Mycena pura]
SVSMRPLPFPPVQLVKLGGSSSTRPQTPTPSVTHTYVVRLPIGAKSQSTVPGGPRAPTPPSRRRDGRIFTHSASSSTSSLASTINCSIISADFWAPPQTQDVIFPTKAAYSIPADDETTVTPDTSTPTTPSTTVTPDTPTPTITDTTPTPKILLKVKAKPANIIIPPNILSATLISPKSKSNVPCIPAAVSCTPQIPLSPLSPLSPHRGLNSPNARIRKLAKLTRTLGENVPLELVFPSSAAPNLVSPASPLQFSKLTFSTGSPTLAPTAPTTTAVGLHYALGMHAAPTRAGAVPTAAGASPASPPPFSHVVTVDAGSWERERQAAFTPRRKTKRAVGGVRKMLADNGRGTWRKKENTWSGEWNVEDMAELQGRLRQLKRY